MARQRSHSIAFKRQVAQEFIAGESLYALSNRMRGEPNKREISQSSQMTFQASRSSNRPIWQRC